MSTVQSVDGTTIGYDKTGDGPPLILVDGALRSRAFGPMPKLAALLAQNFTVYAYDRRGRNESGDTAPYTADREVEDLQAMITAAGGSAFVYGTSSGAALALETAKRTSAITRLALYEPPFIVDGTRSALPADFLARLSESIAAGRPGDAVKQFMKFVGTPSVVVAIMPIMPVWSKLIAVAPTLPYDITILSRHQSGKPLIAEEWKHADVPALVMDGGKSPAWIRNAARSLADVLPAGQYRTLDGQTHAVKAPAIAPVITEFFAS